MKYQILEASIQARRQRFHDLEFDSHIREKDPEQYYTLKGFIQGIDYCIKGEWKKDA